MSSLFYLDGKTILITGASSGIGRATALECALCGANVILVGRNQENLLKTTSLIKEKCNVSVTELMCDLSDLSSLPSLVSGISSIDGAVLNAGISKIVPVKNIKESDINEVLRINTVSQILLFKELLKQKKIMNNVSVVFNSSMAGLGENAIGTSLYAASKSAICGFTKGAALELASKGIRVNTVCPGKVKTELLNSLSYFENKSNEDVSHYPLGRIGEPCDIARAIVFLLSDASSWITGIDLVVDGGLHLKR